ncbi:aminopeptidase [Mesorhizobium sp. BR1-1-9]|uniref:aminopeptidase n=1 Tax=Mesorhizobium sp. BR1-1-9 TaxID=2876646 RepID=UPI001CD1654A|nr:aminopeptidase [Mesorhizobium sp. BR1-1-9]MBZ9870425.1 aminopeptidase [Mesorhizobium sp. BR1-1-9]
MPVASSGLITGTLEYLRRPLVRNIKQGQRVLVLSDTEHDTRVWQAIMTILSDLGADATLALFSRRPADYYDPPAAVCEAMMKSDVNILVSSTGMLHCAASLRSMEAGIPSICLDGGMQLEWFQSGAVTDDMKQIAVRKHYVGKRVFGENAKICRVTSKYGTDFSYSVENKIWIPPLPTDSFDPYKIINFQKDENRPAGKLYYYLYPTGEFNVAPTEGTGNGKLVIDLTMHHLGRLSSPIELTVKDGRVTEIEGGADARILRDFLATYGDENAYMCPAEASVGVNAKAVIRGIQREDKNIMGTLHFGLGTNVDVGGSIMSKIHMDGVILEPTLYVDGVMRIDNGRILVPIESETD